MESDCIELRIGCGPGDGEKFLFVEPVGEEMLEHAESCREEEIEILGVEGFVPSKACLLQGIHNLLLPIRQGSPRHNTHNHTGTHSHEGSTPGEETHNIQRNLLSNDRNVYVLSMLAHGFPPINSLTSITLAFEDMAENTLMFYGEFNANSQFNLQGEDIKKLIGDLESDVPVFKVCDDVDSNHSPGFQEFFL